jgi:hypothetical protein
MHCQDFFTHYPSRLLWTGGGVICALAFLSGILLLPVADQPVFPLPPRKTNQTADSQRLASLHLDGRNHQALWALPPIEQDLLISLSPPRPPGDRSQPIAHVRLKGSGQSKRFAIPGRIYLSFNDQGVISFRNEEGPFWMDLSLEGNDALAAQIIVMNQGEEVARTVISRRADEPPLQKGEEFPAGSALRILGDARWRGVDLVSQLGSREANQRLEIGSASLNVGEKEWIGWKEGRWSKIDDPGSSGTAPIARIRSISSQSIEWDAWDDSHVRIAMALQSAPMTHAKTEEWLNSVRIRSEKQISCMLEKQCFILRAGDWVLKENNRWRVIRKTEEKQQLISGNKTGELFVLEKIDSKQKLIKGRLILANRTQMIPVELTAANPKLEKKHVPAREMRHARGGNT